jgi:hypothetical protein
VVESWNSKRRVHASRRLRHHGAGIHLPQPAGDAGHHARGVDGVFVDRPAFAALYSLVFDLDSQTFRLPGWIERGSAEVVPTEMVSFSLVTLATLNYGDILPSADSVG